VAPAWPLVTPPMPTVADPASGPFEVFAAMMFSSSSVVGQ
jgi:hypothetical protein